MKFFGKWQEDGKVKNDLTMYDALEAGWEQAIDLTEIVSGSGYLIESLSRDRSLLRVEASDMEDVDAIVLLSTFTQLGDANLMLVTEGLGDSRNLPADSRTKEAAHCSYGISFPKVAKFYIVMGTSRDVAGAEMNAPANLTQR